jgi:hypothetical protein
MAKKYLNMLFFWYICGSIWLVRKIIKIFNNKNIGIFSDLT